MTETCIPHQASSKPLPRGRWWWRMLCVVLGLAAWFGTQSLIGKRPDQGPRIGDVLLDWTAPLHERLHASPAAADALLVVSSAIIDILGVMLLGRAVFGPTIRPFVALLMVFVMRQVCQGLCILPPPDGMIWRYPGVPSLLVTYGVSNDMFFSGHTALAIVGAVELARSPGPGAGSLWRAGAVMLGVSIALFEIAAVIVLRAHWTMDVYAGIVSALLAALVADRVAPWIDARLSRGARAA